MENLFGVVTVLLIIAMIVTAIVLFFGVFSMGRSGKFFSPRLSNKLMRMRVIFQGIALVLLGFMALVAFMR